MASRKGLEGKASFLRSFSLVDFYCSYCSFHAMTWGSRSCCLSTFDYLPDSDVQKYVPTFLSVKKPFPISSGISSGQNDVKLHMYRLTAYTAIHQLHSIYQLHAAPSNRQHSHHCKLKL